VVQDSLCLGFKSVVVEDSRCLRLKTVVTDSAEFPSWHMACHHARVLEGVVKRQFYLQDSSVWRATRARVLEGVAKGQLALQNISFKSRVETMGSPRTLTLSTPHTKQHADVGFWVGSTHGA